MKPDAVIVAAGGAAPPLNVPGADKEIVLSRNDAGAMRSGGPARGGLMKKVMSFGASVVIKEFYDPDMLRKALKYSNFPFGKKVIILGGNYAGCELAETLAHAGKKVTIIEESPKIGSDIGIIHKWVFRKNMKELGVQMITKAKLVSIEDKGINITQDDKPSFIEANTVVKIGVIPDLTFSNELEKRGFEVYTVGDCGAAGGMLLEATGSGFIAGHKV